MSNQEAMELKPGDLVDHVMFEFFKKPKVVKWVSAEGAGSMLSPIVYFDDDGGGWIARNLVKVERVDAEPEAAAAHPIRQRDAWEVSYYELERKWIARMDKILGLEIEMEAVTPESQRRGSSHDGIYCHRDWLLFIEKQGMAADREAKYGLFLQYEKRLIKIAALAVAAVKDSRQKRAPRA
jgi:hypothetical protein